MTFLENKPNGKLFDFGGMKVGESLFSTNIPPCPGRLFRWGVTIIFYEHIIRPGELWTHEPFRVADGNRDATNI